MLPSHSSKHQERLTNYNVGFCCLSKRLEFTPSHPRAFSMAYALWIAVTVKHFIYDWAISVLSYTSLLPYFLRYFFHDKKVSQKV